jgi:hypothetical protein
MQLRHHCLISSLMHAGVVWCGVLAVPVRGDEQSNACTSSTPLLNSCCPAYSSASPPRATGGAPATASQKLPTDAQPRPLWLLSGERWWWAVAALNKVTARTSSAPLSPFFHLFPLSLLSTVVWLPLPAMAYVGRRWYRSSHGGLGSTLCASGFGLHQARAGAAQWSSLAQPQGRPVGQLRHDGPRSALEGPGSAF